MHRTMKGHLFNDQRVEAVTDVGYPPWVATNYTDRKGQMEVR